MNMPILFLSGLILIFSGCALFKQQEQLRISVAGIEPLEGKGMEARFAVQLRVQNHSASPLGYEGAALNLDLYGASFASGVSDQRGTIARFGEAIITVPVTVPATALLRHVFELAANDNSRAKPKVDYRLRGLLGGPGLGGGQRFDVKGEFTLPTAGSDGVHSIQ